MFQRPVRISAVSYLNALPFIKGLEISDPSHIFQVSRDVPSECARKLKEKSVDIGLIPVAAIPGIDNAGIIGNYCIASSGNVKSVLLVSDVPLEDITSVTLDRESRTSVLLARVLALHSWKKNISWNHDPLVADNLKKGKGSVVMIGDKALLYGDRFNYRYDLATEWKKFTGLPFVFACWVANRVIDPDAIALLEKCCETGLQLRKQVADENKERFPGINLEEYLDKNIEYSLDENKRKGLQLFLKYISEINN